MSAIAAVFSRDGRDHLDATLDMLIAASHRASGPPRTFRAGAAVLGSRGRRGAVVSPTVHPSSGNAVVFDGRLDNRGDLIAALALTTPVTDGEVVLAAYERWREGAPRALLGDFAFAVWDAAARRLFCARDALGQRPLFYANAGSLVAIGSEPQQVLSHPAVRQEINEAVVAEHLAGMPTTVDETLWRGVMRLPPAHTLVASSAGTRVSRYWDFDADARLEYPRDGEYAEHFAYLFRAAVACRMRDASRGVGVFLSGGIDSSAVAVMADRLHRSGAAPSVRAFSLAFPRKPCDESRYIDAVVRHAGIAATSIDSVAATRGQVEAEIARYRDLPAFPNGSNLDPLRVRAAASVDAVLTGYGGDDWFTGSHVLHIADLVRDGRVLAAAGQWWADRRLSGGRSRMALTRAVVAPLLPHAIRPIARVIAGTAPPVFEWIRPEFATRTALRERLRRPQQAGFRTHVQRAIHAIAGSAMQVIGDELEERAAAYAGIEQRHPFYDRRVAEFGFALPDSQRWAGGETKVVIRRALAGDLPPAVLRRRDKAEFSSTFVEALEPLGGRAIFDDLRTARAGWVDAAAIVAKYDRLIDLYRRGDAAYIPLTGPVWAVAAVELWLRHIEGVTRDRATDAAAAG